jgi:hypothetical protein
LKNYLIIEIVAEGMCYCFFPFKKKKEKKKLVESLSKRVGKAKNAFGCTVTPP